MADKKLKSKKEPALTKSDMVNYIGPVFEELKGDLRRDMKSMGAQLFNDLKVLFETDSRLNAFSDVMKLSGENSSKLEDHEERISHIEKSL